MLGWEIPPPGRKPHVHLFMLILDCNKKPTEYNCFGDQTCGRPVGAASTHSHPHGEGSDVTHVHTASNEESVSRTIRQLNKAPKIPIFTLGVGFDANVKFLENVAEVSCGKSCTGLVIEDIDTAPQLRAVQQVCSLAILFFCSQFLDKNGQNCKSLIPQELGGDLRNGFPSLAPTPLLHRSDCRVRQSDLLKSICCGSGLWKS